jgi:hypothetical protein
LSLVAFVVAGNAVLRALQSKALPLTFRQADLSLLIPRAYSYRPSRGGQLVRYLSSISERPAYCNSHSVDHDSTTIKVLLNRDEFTKQLEPSLFGGKLTVPFDKKVMHQEVSRA